MAFIWYMDLPSSHQLKNKSLSKLDPLGQSFMNPHMAFTLYDIYHSRIHGIDVASKINLSTPPLVVSAAVCCEAEVLLLLIHCLFCFHSLGRGVCWAFVLLCGMLCPFYFAEEG